VQRSDELVRGAQHRDGNARQRRLEVLERAHELFVLEHTVAVGVGGGEHGAHRSRARADDPQAPQSLFQLHCVDGAAAVFVDFAKEL
jgi:hypothetical protein